MKNRKFALYFSWSRPRETGAKLGQLDNRFPALFEFRRAIWPSYEWSADPTEFNQDISGFLDHVILFDFGHFNKIISETTGNPVSLFQREGDAPPVKELDERFLKDIDTLVVVSLDHFRTEQTASPGELAAIAHFIEREDACLVICPHHDVGAGNVLASREVEFRHHDDRLVPSQQQIGGFARSLFSGLSIPIENCYGLSPAKSEQGDSPAPLQIFPSLDRLNVLGGVDTFNLHPHLPHLRVVDPAEESVHVLARQLINPAASSHPFVDAGNRHFNSLIWISPEADRGGNVFVCDATLWSAAFSGVKSLEVFWRNLARLKR